MKKFISLAWLCVFLPFIIFAGNYSSDFSIVVITSVNNISESESSWLGAAVEERLEANLSKYTNLKIVNNSNKQQILQLQKQSEGAAFDEKTAIEVGKYTTAEKGMFVTVRKAGSIYTIAIRVTDLTTGENIATVVSSGKKNIEDLYAFSGCAVDEITITLCDQLGISLTPGEKHIIIHGDSGLTNEEKVKLYEADLQLYSKQIKELDREIDLLRGSTDVESVFRENQLKAEKALAEEKLKLVRENQRRAEEDAKRQRDDEIKDRERTEAQKDRINSMSVELNEKLQQVRNSKLEQESVLGQIKIIELKKKSLVEIKQKIDFEKNQILDYADKIIAEKTDEIKNRVPRTVETDGRGNLTESAKANRNREIKEETDKILENAYSDIKQIKEKIDSQNRALLKDIYEDYKRLGEKTVNTLGTELIVDYGNYDGNKAGWPLFITVKSDDVIIFKTTSFLPYRDLTGHEPVNNSSSPNFIKYANEVDLYDSLFFRGEPIVTYEIDYTVKPMSLNYPSQYRFYFNSLKWFDTRTMSVKGKSIRGENCGILFLDENQITKQMHPAYDLRDFESIANYDYETTVADIPGYKGNSNSNGNWKDKIIDDDYESEDNYEDSDSEIKQTSKSKVNHKRENGRNLIAFNYGFVGLDITGSAFQFDFASAINNYVFLDFNVDVLLPERTKKSLYPVTAKSDTIMNFSFGVGGNYKLNNSYFKPNFYGLISLGANLFQLDNNEKKSFIDFVVSLETGVDFPIGDVFAFTTSYGIDFVVTKGIYHKTSLGGAILFRE